MQTVSPSPLLIRAIAAEDTYPLRQAVLWPDKPLDFVKVADDADGQHFGAFRQTELVAVISLFGPGHDAPGGLTRFRKFATHPDYQRQGIGSALLTHVFAEAIRLGASGIWCDARLDAAPLYQRFGMEPEGAVFYKGPIPYSRMSRMF
jgi:GNAT superfamily N-acetyltransferase